MELLCLSKLIAPCLLHNSSIDLLSKAALAHSRLPDSYSRFAHGSFDTSLLTLRSGIDMTYRIGAPNSIAPKSLSPHKGISICARQSAREYEEVILISEGGICVPPKSEPSPTQRGPAAVGEAPGAAAAAVPTPLEPPNALDPGLSFPASPDPEFFFTSGSQGSHTGHIPSTSMQFPPSFSASNTSSFTEPGGKIAATLSK
mmetsp:Transcript_13700/g.27871  ORF Transcript_13700/g.27871 Transcript_13700/m.27871 type:complete len:201 (-) Transcript_13700:2315-2917(-)